MINAFNNHRTPKTSLSWDDYYPKSYVYKPSESLSNLKEIKIEIKIKK